MNRTEPAVVFVAPGDLHLTAPDRDNYKTALWVVDEVNRLVRPDFVQFVGDNVQNAREAEVEWLRAEVDRARARGERVVLFQHHYPYKVWEQYDGPGLDAWREVVQTRRVEAIFTGHTHYGQTANDCAACVRWRCWSESATPTPGRCSAGSRPAPPARG